MKSIGLKTTTTMPKRSFTYLPRWALVLGLTLAPWAVRAAETSPQSSFYLKAGDHVCFYGDSITEQRFYGLDVETYVRTRFPNLRVRFVNSGVGGDRVTGGWAGPIDLRLARDVFPFKPNVVTIMLGMNDASYRPFDQKIFDVYTNGYEHIIQSLQAHLPGVRIVLLEPSPYDDVTESPKFAGGYNGVLLRYAAFVRQLASEHGLPCIDLNRPLVKVMEKAQAGHPKLAHDVIPGRVHPSAAGELVMAQAILQAWNAPAIVTSVTLDAAADNPVQAVNTTVSQVKTSHGILSWKQQDRCLPFPILALHDDWPQFPPVQDRGMSMFWGAPRLKWNHTNPGTDMIVRYSGFYDALDRQPLRVTGLREGTYELKINGQPVAKLSAEQLDRGINLARYRTPMLEQSYQVLRLVWQQIQWRYFAWRGIELPMSIDHDPAVGQAERALIAALRMQKEGIVQRQYAAVATAPTFYELLPAGD
jgi:lysophospholipase L1-like esterase